MKFKFDENLPVAVQSVLREYGHESSTVHEQGLSGCKDSELLETCRREGLALVTLDTDFSDIRTYPPQNFHGLVVLRPINQSVRNVRELVVLFAEMLKTEPLAKTLWIVEPGKIRAR